MHYTTMFKYALVAEVIFAFPYFLQDYEQYQSYFNVIAYYCNNTIKPHGQLKLK